MSTRFWPLGAGRIVTSPFGPRTGGFHFGTDFGRAGGSAGMPVYAVADGTVIHAGAAQGYGGPDPAGWLVIDHPATAGGGCSEYGHIVREVARGDVVRAGQRIGHINPDSRTNGGTAPHLHLSVMPREYNPAAKIDPIPWLGAALEPGGDRPLPKIWSGRMTWLYDVLRAELGTDRVRALPGWETRGHGDFKDVRGVMNHHTGNSRETAESIARGRSDLPGPLSNWHTSPDGIVTVVAAGVCWHAGQGSYPWLPTNMGNWHLLGAENAWPFIRPDGSYDPRERWPDAQVIAMRDATSAVLGHMGYLQDRAIDHKDYAGRAQGKWDRGNMDPEWFRGEVRLDLIGHIFPGERPEGVSLPPGTPLPVIKPVITPGGPWRDILLWKGMPGPDPQVRELQRRLSAAYLDSAQNPLRVFGLYDSELLIDTLELDIRGSSGEVRLFYLTDSSSAVRVERLIVRAGGAVWRVADFNNQNGSLSIGRIETDTAPGGSGYSGVGASAAASIGDVPGRGPHPRGGAPMESTFTAVAVVVALAVWHLFNRRHAGWRACADGRLNIYCGYALVAIAAYWLQVAPTTTTWEWAVGNFWALGAMVAFVTGFGALNQVTAEHALTSQVIECLDGSTTNLKACPPN